MRTGCDARIRESSEVARRILLRYSVGSYRPLRLLYLKIRSNLKLVTHWPSFIEGLPGQKDDPRDLSREVVVDKVDVAQAPATTLQYHAPL